MDTCPEASGSHNQLLSFIVRRTLGLTMTMMTRTTTTLTGPVLRADFTPTLYEHVPLALTEVLLTLPCHRRGRSLGGLGARPGPLGQGEVAEQSLPKVFALCPFQEAETGENAPQ